MEKVGQTRSLESFSNREKWLQPEFLGNCSGGKGPRGEKGDFFKYRILPGPLGIPWGQLIKRRIIRPWEIFWEKTGDS